ncbi:autotransporter outer membrane beta-barrel domain-containing protein [Achromobacter xylosoxidans]
MVDRGRGRGARRCRAGRFGVGAGRGATGRTWHGRFRRRFGRNGRAGRHACARQFDRHVHGQWRACRRPGARYEVEVDPAGKASDLTRVTGKATLNGGSVALVGNGGSYALRSTYTILTADQGLSGAFEGVASRYAFLDPTLSYDANNAYLNLARNDVSFVDAARTRNQAAVARAIERIGVNAANPVYDAVVQLPTAVAARGAFDQLSGEILASARTALIEDSRHVREAVTDRLRAAWGGAGCRPNR